MTRCHYCHRYVWPWQRQGWRIGDWRMDTVRWHGRCYRDYEQFPAARQPQP